jgi:hypothetical protein
MRKRKFFRFAFLLISFTLVDCRLTLAAAGTNPATQTALAFSIIQYSTSAGGRFPTATFTPPGARPATPTASRTPQPTASLTVAHESTPPGAAGTTRYITDPVTRDYAPQKRSPSGSDVYQGNRWERPYTAETMEYLPDVDLTRVELRISPPWVYVTFFLSGARAEGVGRTMYGAEFDTNRDGRGEYLIWGASPPGAEWTAEGVEAWQDSNGDVGGPNPQAADAPWTGGDGYDRSLFAGGQGADPDLAWIRQLEGGTKIQLAFKYSAIGNAPQFLWNGLADLGIRNPAWFDYNDHFTQGEAGSPLTVQPDYYPLKALFGIDNTCRDAYGFAPTGMEPGLCQYPGTIGGVVAWDIDHNGVLDPTEISTAAISGDTITLGQGACPADGYRTAVTDAQGRYSFPDLPYGTYCVGAVHTTPWPIDVPSVTVSLAPGQNKTVNFALPW